MHSNSSVNSTFPTEVPHLLIHKHVQQNITLKQQTLQILVFDSIKTQPMKLGTSNACQLFWLCYAKRHLPLHWHQGHKLDKMQ